MLQRIGDAFKSRKWLTYVLFGALAFIFAAWGAYGIASLQFTTSEDAAKVNGQTIPYSEVREAWLQQQAEWEQRNGGQMPPAVQRELENQLVEQFIRDTVMAQDTHRLGYRVSEAQVAQAIREEPAFQLAGQYSPDVAKMRLQQAGITPDEYEEDLREALRAAQLQGGIRDSDFLTSREAARIAALENEQRKIQYAIVPAAEFTSAVPIDEKSVQAYYAAHQAQFMTREFVRVQYAELDLADVTSQVQVAELDLHDYYDKHKSQYVQPDRRRVRHILIAAGGTRSDAAAFARAGEVLAKLKAGASFAALAQQYSDDSGSASQGGDLGWAERSALPAGPFADTVFSMQVNEIRGPVKSEYGYHILELEGIEPGKAESFEQARTAIEPVVRHSEATDRFGDIEEQIQQQLDDGTPTLEGLAKSFGMRLGEVAQFERGTGGAPLGNAHDLEDTVFSDAALAEHRIGGPVLIGDSRMVLVRDLEHHLPAPRPLAEVREAIVAVLRKQRANEAAAAAARAAVLKLESGTAFEAVVRDLGVRAEPPHFVGRTDPSVPTPIRAAVFASPKPARGKPVFLSFALDAGGAALLAVTDVTDATGPADPDQQASLHQRAIAYGTEAADDYLEQLRLTAKVRKNLEAFEQ